MTTLAVSSNNEKHIKMTTTPVEKLIVSLAAPSIVIMLTVSLYDLANTFFVSALGTSEVAAVGIALPLKTIIQAMGFMFGQGIGNYMSRALGARDTEAASRMAATGFVSGFAVMAVFAAAGIIGLEPLVSALGATETIRPHAREYVFFILLASPWMLASTVLNLMLRFQGSAAIAMVGMLSGTILNIFLAPLFIFTFGMGVRGAGFATMICQIVSFVILLFYGCTRKGNIPIKLSFFSLSPSWYAEIFRGGFPSLLRQGFMSVSFIVINHFARGHGDAAIAAIAIVQRLCMFASSIMLGVGQGFQPVCGFNYGAKHYDRVKKAFWFCVRFCTVGLIVISALMALFAPQIIALFRSDDLEVIAIGTRGLRLNSISLPLTAFMVMSGMMTQTMGKTLEASILAIARQGLFLIPSLFVLSPFLGLLGTQLSIPASDILGFVVSALITVRVLKGLSGGAAGTGNAPACQIPL